MSLSSAAALIPHPSKQDKGGEDAFFISPSTACVGVADGVGGWAEIGVDPGLYSRELMRRCQDEVESVKAGMLGPDTPQRALEAAHAATEARGSCTACVLCLLGATLHGSNLGDSGFMVVRAGRLAFMSPQQQHEFNFPYQVGGWRKGAGCKGGWRGMSNCRD
jgi:protein phosphatase PTC7